MGAFVFRPVLVKPIVSVEPSIKVPCIVSTKNFTEEEMSGNVSNAKRDGSIINGAVFEEPSPDDKQISNGIKNTAYRNLVINVSLKKRILQRCRASNLRSNQLQI